MKSFKLISFTTFFILLVITSSLADENDDKDENKNKGKNNGKDNGEDEGKSTGENIEDTVDEVIDKLGEVKTKDKAMIGGVVGGIFVVIILLVCLFYPKCPMYPLSAPCRDYCCPDFVNPFNRETAVKREVKDGQIETTKGQWITPVEDA